jgi:hypothetical protein
MARALLAALAAMLLCLGMVACGGSSAANTTQTPAHDRDNDGDHNDDDAHLLDYGHAAYGAEKQAIVATLREYYAVAAAENGAKACSMLDPVIVESVVEDYGHTSELSGKTCAQVVTKLFVRDHATLAGENATFKIYAVRVNGRIELTVLSFASLPEVRQLSVRHEDGSWKVLGLEDGIIE